MLLKGTFASPLLKHRREGREKNDNYTGNCKVFCVTRKRNKLQGKIIINFINY